MFWQATASADPANTCLLLAKLPFLGTGSFLNQAASLTPDTVGMCSTFVASVALILLLDAHDDAVLAERDGLKGEAVWNRVAVQLVDAVKVVQAA